MPFLEVQQLTKKYGSSVVALDQLSFGVEEGEWIAVMGPSGSGKSTLLNILGGLDTPTDGRVILNGLEISGFSAKELARFRAEQVGFIFQQSHLVPYLTALENVMLAQYFHSLADEKEAADSLARVGLGDRLHHLPSQLSGGEQQRVCVARALANQAKLILADEPTGSLDEVNEAMVMGLISRLHHEGHTILLVTHDPEMGRLAQRRIELHHGRLSEVSVFPVYEEELIENLLKAVWHAQEDLGKEVFSTAAVPEFAQNRATFLLMAQENLVCLTDGELSLTQTGEGRAQEVIRRHRLSECLFYETFGIDKDLLDENACKIEHTLSQEVTEKLCVFLRHPQTCPHGSPIPRGACCLKG